MNGNSAKKFGFNKLTQKIKRKLESTTILKDLKSSFDNIKYSVEEVLYNELIFLWFSDYYDGMLEGMLKYKNQKYKFKIITDYTKNIYPRLFAIIILSESEIKEEEYWNELFEKYVGNHNNLEEVEQKEVKPQSQHHLFFNDFNKRKIKNYNTNPVKGWFIES